MCVDTGSELAETVEIRDTLCWLDPTRANCGWAGETSSYVTLDDEEVAENKMLVLKHLLLLLIYSFLEGRVV